MVRVLPIALALLVGCASSGQQPMARALSLPLGNPRAACQGGEKRVEVGQTTEIQRRLAADGEACVLTLSWEGALLAAEERGLERIASGAASLARLELRFEPLSLTDELGQAIEVKIPELTFELRAGKTQLLELAAKAQGPLWGKGAAVELPATLRDEVADHLRRNVSVPARAKLRVVVDAASRKALQGAARGPLFVLHYVIRLEEGPAAPTSAPASSPASRSNTPTPSQER